MNKLYPYHRPIFAIIFFFFFGLLSSNLYSQINFSQSVLDFNGNGDVSSGVTSLMYGPDGRLYVAEYPGTIKILTIQRNSATNYIVTSVETLNGVKNIVNYDDDGTPCSGDPGNCTSRETTGLTVGGNAANPVIYITSSDFRIGAGEVGGNGDVDLDTNSGIITRFSWNGSSWDVVDLVRGLPRSEENHATNGLELTNINGTNYLVVASGGNTNGGSPSTNFVYTCEYALSAAILSVNLDMLNGMGIQIDGNGRDYIYDLPTLDDPSRANVNGITDPDTPGYNGEDVNDPFGGNDGLNQAVVVPGGPVQILSPGYRNSYDLVVTESGALYVTENGANIGWGGFPVNEGDGTVTNDYDPAEPGSQSSSGGEQINNEDHLELITTDLQNYSFGSFYGGHPNPTRANPNGAGLFTAPASNGTAGAVFRTLIYDPDGSRGAGYTTDASIALPANWPPVSVTNSIEGDWRGPGINNPDGPDDNPVTLWGTNTNGIDEYTASNFGGAMQGNLLAGHNVGNVRRVQLNGSGTLQQLTQNFFSGISGNALGITCNSDTEVFPGTVWTGSLGGNGGGNITVFEPQDFVTCLNPGEPGYDPNADYDSDGYTNQDEEDNGTDACNGGSQPDDFDKIAGGSLISDLNDTDDDADGISDALDSFQLGNPSVGGSDAFELPVNNDLFNSQQGLGGVFGLGLTGLMNNGDTGANWLEWLDDRGQGPNPDDVLGGAPGLMTSHMTSGTALGSTNTQEKGYQYGIQTDQNSGTFTVFGNLISFTGPLRLYGNTAAVGGELGHFIGDGTQSNYIKIVITTNGITALQEINDVPQAPINIPIATQDRPTNAIVFYFVVDPATGQVNLQYAIDGGTRKDIGTITAQGSILTAIQQNNTDLAVGFIGTSNTPGVELEGTWDFLNVIGEVPTIAQQIPDIIRPINTSDEDNDLDQFFDDDNGTANLTYTVEGNTNPSIGATIAGSTLTLSYPATPAISDITIRATDTDTFFVEQTFTVTVTDAPIVLYRVNSGGPQIMAIDGGLDWGVDQTSNLSPYLTQAGTNDSFLSSTMPVDGSVDQSTTPLSIYASERFDDTAGSPNVTYSFPVALSGNYEIRLYMGNSFSGTSQPGERIFDTEIEGVILPLLNQIDLSATYGHQTGTVITHILNITDGAIDISFLHGSVENPLINAIEILDAPDTNTPIYVNPIPDQLSNSGQQLNGSLGVSAYGGDGNLQYAATGLPTGVVIEPTNGQIGGTIDAGASTNSPYNVTITVDDSDGLSSDEVVINFVWNVVDATSYRINTGGNEVLSTDIGLNWEENSQSGMQTGGNYTVNTGLISGSGGVVFENRDVSIPAYMDELTFNGLFAQERYDEPNAPEMEYTLLLDNGNYVVNMYFSNSFSGTSQPGERVFDILLEGNLVRDNLDLITEFGHQVGGMLSFPVIVADGELNISFGHEVENPIINAIEIYLDDQAFQPLTLAPISDQLSDAGEQIDISTVASGGDPGENISYYISGQPQGIGIDLNAGQISGTVDFLAAVGGPNGDGTYITRVTILKPGSAPATQVFTWNIISSLFWVDKDENENYTARHECSFVQAGDKFYLMGGRENGQTIDVYDYTSDSWNSLVDSAPFEFNHFQATEYQGLIWVIGAFGDNNFPNEIPEENIWIFDPANQEWIQGPLIPVNRRRGSSGLSIYNNKFYITGGNTIGHNGGYVEWFDEFDPATGIWTSLADAPRARDHFHTAVIGDQLFVAGGRLSGGPGGVWAPTIAEVDVYDFNTNSWTTLPAGQNIPTPRGAPAVANFNGKLVVIGGEVENELVYGVNTDDALKITEEYDPIAQSWTRLPDLNFDRHGTQAIVSGNGIFITAGAPNRGGGNQKNMEYLGVDAPVGNASISSTLSVPASILIADGTSEDINLDVINGNEGIIVRSMEITGPNAADFSIDAGALENALLNSGSTNTISVSLSGTGINRSANLTINYGATSSINIVLSNNENLVLDVANPGNQYNYEGDSVSLQIEAVSSNSLTYSATGLPPDLTINSNTGVITGTISAGAGGGSAFIEENGLVVIESESGTLVPSWSQTSVGGTSGIIAGSDNFNNQNGGTIPYQMTISTPGVYRFNWRSFYSGTDPTEENDNWLRFPNNNDVWFFGFQGTPSNEASLISNLQGPQNNIVFPVGSGRESAGTIPEGASSNGYLKVYRSGGASEVYDWQALTNDNAAHDVYVWFVNPGTYTMEISERSVGHAIDRVALYKLDGPDYSDTQLSGFPESSTGGGPGAAANSPYAVEVTVIDNDVPPATSTVQFDWIVGEQGDLIAVPEADPVSGEVPLTVDFTGSNSLDDVGVTSYLWDFMDGSPTSSTADPTHTFTSVGDYDVELTVEDIDSNTSTNSITIMVTSPANQPPVVTNPGDQNNFEGEVVSLQILATDPESGVLDYAATGLPTGLTIDSGTGLISGTVTAGAAASSPFAVTITVSDDGTPIGSAMIAFEWVIDITTNLPPVVTNPGDQSNFEGEVVSLQILATDPESGTLDYAAAGLPTGLIIDLGTGLISGTVTAGAAASSPFAVTITVSDDGTPIGSAMIAFEWVIDITTNLPPVVTNPGDQSNFEGEIVSLQILATDPESGTLDYAATGLPTGLTIDSTSGLISGTVSAGATASSPFAVSITVTDDGIPVQSELINFEWIISIDTNNQPPVAVTTSNLSNGIAPLAVSFNGESSSDDIGIVSYAWDFMDGSVSSEINPNYIFTVDGTYNVELTVTDAGGLTDTAVVTIVVGESSNLPPIAVLEATPTSGDAPLEVAFVGGNSTDDFGVVSYLWDFGDGSTSSEMDPSYIYTFPGNYTVVLSVEDAAGLTNSATTTILVEAVAGEMMGIILENPSKEGIAKIQLINQPSDVEVRTIYLHDSSGRLVGTYNPQDIFNGITYDVPVGAVETGMYYVGLEMSGADPILLKLLVSN